MMKLFLKPIFIVFISIVIILIVGVLFMHILFPTPLSKKATENEFIKNQDSFILIVNYLVNCDEDSIYIPNIDVKAYTDIDNLQVASAIKVLFSKGYSVISKDGNTIHFQRSTRFRDFGSGVAYSLDGSDPQLPYLIRLETLSEPNWYYYEEDFNEYKKLNNISM